MKKSFFISFFFIPSLLWAAAHDDEGLLDRYTKVWAKAAAKQLEVKEEKPKIKAVSDSTPSSRFSGSSLRSTLDSAAQAYYQDIEGELEEIERNRKERRVSESSKKKATGEVSRRIIPDMGPPKGTATQRAGGEPSAAALSVEGGHSSATTSSLVSAAAPFTNDNTLPTTSVLTNEETALSNDSTFVMSRTSETASVSTRATSLQTFITHEEKLAAILDSITLHASCLEGGQLKLSGYKSLYHLFFPGTSTPQGKRVASLLPITSQRQEYLQRTPNLSPLQFYLIVTLDERWMIEELGEIEREIMNNVLSSTISFMHLFGNPINFWIPFKKAGEALGNESFPYSSIGDRDTQRTDMTQLITEVLLDALNSPKSLIQGVKNGEIRVCDATLIPPKILCLPLSDERVLNTFRHCCKYYSRMWAYWESFRMTYPSQAYQLLQMLNTKLTETEATL